MKTLRLSAFALASAAALPMLLSAQAPVPNNTTPYSFHFDGTNSAGITGAGGAVVGPYSINQVTKNQFSVFCVDFDNLEQTDWSARVVTFQSIIGVNQTAAARVLGVASVTQAQLRTVGYLSTQLNPANQANWATIHGEIWSIFSSNPSLSQYVAGATAASAIAAGNSDYDAFDMLIDERAFSVGGCTGTSVCSQTFIVPDGDLTGRIVTPEPATYALMGAGLLAVGFVRRRRNNKLA